MYNQHEKVVGSYENEKETKQAIRDLMGQGFRKDQLTIYTNEKKEAFFSNVESVQIAQTDDTDANNEHNEDKNFWESIRDAFKVREDTDFEDPNYVPEDDLLNPYRNDLSNGRYVIVVDESDGKANTRETPSDNSTDHSTHPHLNTLGTTAGFPDEGSVQGMGDGGQPNTDSHSGDGTPPELEDTEGTADKTQATNDRLNETRKDNS